MPASDRWPLRRAADAVRRGGVVAYPTEAVYGLGCDPLNGGAVLRLLAIKQRPIDMGLILIGADFAQLAPFIDTTQRAQITRALRSWPGPVTWLLPAAREVPLWLRGRHDTVAVRVTAHPLAAALCRAVGGALVSSSANRHRQPPARTALQVRRRFGKQIDFVLVGEVGTARRPTEIRDAASGRVVRPG